MHHHPLKLIDFNSCNLDVIISPTDKLFNRRDPMLSFDEIGLLSSSSSKSIDKRIRKFYERNSQLIYLDQQR